MIVEDDFLSELNDYEHRIAESEKQKEEERRQKEEERRQKEEERRQKEEAVKLLLKTGMPKLEIARSLNIPLDYLDNLS
ncbi:MAG: hypothetical protein IPO37_13950 [Saprospiraceae bacterium]|nr:hypothetical protein [Saprospiraceae bacterium]